MFSEDTLSGPGLEAGVKLSQGNEKCENPRSGKQFSFWRKVLGRIAGLRHVRKPDQRTASNELAVEVGGLGRVAAGPGGRPGPFVSPKMCGRQRGPEVCSAPEHSCYSSSFNDTMSSWSPEVPGMN